MMKKQKVFILGSLATIACFALMGYVNKKDDPNFSERAKISIRDTGNKLLLSQGDSTSLILPIIEIDEKTFEMSFQNQLSIWPDSLVSILKKSLGSSNLPNSYIVEVLDGDSGEVSYSYEVKNEEEKNLIPCLERKLPYHDYKIKVRFTGTSSFLISDVSQSLLPFVLIGFMGVGLLYRKRESLISSNVPTSKYLKIGAYKFYKEQNKLVKGNAVIELTSKECELMTLFAEKPNQIIKRDLLVKKVWEDNGVIVGRSLDTFISKLRKKLKHDGSIRISNVHGVGYKLETFW